MIAELAEVVNDLTIELTPSMYLDLRPEEQLISVVPNAEQPALAYLAGLSRNSRRPMWHALRVVAAILTRGELDPLRLPWHQLTRQHVVAVRAKLVEQYAPAHGQRIMAALRGVLKESWRLGQMTADAYQRAVDVKPIKGSGPDHAAGRALSAGEITALLHVCRLDASAAGPRDATILGLGVRCGLRREEIASLRVEHYDSESAQLRVLGKGNKTRVVYVGPGVDDALADWLHVRSAAHGEMLFVAIDKSGRLHDGGLTAEAIYKLLAKRAKQAGVKAFSPHDLRRTYAGDLLDAGADIATVQKLMGHASATTTASYDRRGERAKRAAAGRLHLPWQRRYET